MPWQSVGCVAHISYFTKLFMIAAIPILAFLSLIFCFMVPMWFWVSLPLFILTHNIHTHMQHISAYVLGCHLLGSTQSDRFRRLSCAKRCIASEIVALDVVYRFSCVSICLILHFSDVRLLLPRGNLLHENGSFLGVVGFDTIFLFSGLRGYVLPR